MQSVNVTRGRVLAEWERETFTVRNNVRDNCPKLGDAIDALADGNGTIADVVKCELTGDEVRYLRSSWPELADILLDLSAEHFPMTRSTLRPEPRPAPIEEARLSGIVKLSKILDEVIGELSDATMGSPVFQDRDYWRKLAAKRREAMAAALRELSVGHWPAAAGILTESLQGSRTGA